MFTLNKDSSHTAALITYLQDQDPKVRLTVYYALAEYIVPNTLSKFEMVDIINNVSGIRHSLKEIVYRINELAIIDASLLERIFNNVLEFRIKSITNISTYNTNLIDSNCFQDIIGVTRYYPADDIHTINSNFDLFKRVVGEVVQYLREQDYKEKING